MAHLLATSLKVADEPPVILKFSNTIPLNAASVSSVTKKLVKSVDPRLNVTPVPCIDASGPLNPPALGIVNSEPEVRR